MVAAGIFVWDSQKAVSKEDGRGAQSRKRHINVEAIGPDQKVSAAAFSHNVYSAESET